MDIDFMKSASPEEHIEMMTMMMQMAGNLPAASYEDSADDFPSAEHYFNNINHHLQQQCHHNNNNLHNTDNIVFDHHPSSAFPISDDGEGDKRSSNMAAMREMIFRIAAMQPVHIDPESVKPPKRKNVKISTDPQSVAARHRRERISERIRTLQRLVPGGTKMDTASMLDEAIHYVKFLKNQVQSLESVAANWPAPAVGIGFPVTMSGGGGGGSYCFPAAVVGVKGYHQYSSTQ